MLFYSKGKQIRQYKLEMFILYNVEIYSILKYVYCMYNMYTFHCSYCPSLYSNGKTRFMIIMICFYFQIENLQEQLRDKDKQLTNLKDRVKSLQTDSSNTDTALATLEEALSEKVMCSYATAHYVLLLQVKHIEEMSS